MCMSAVDPLLCAPCDLILGERIGKGSYGVVVHAVARDSRRSTEVAAKIVPLDASDAGEVQREAVLQREAGRHPSIVKLLGSFHHEGSACAPPQSLTRAAAP